MKVTGSREQVGELVNSIRTEAPTASNVRSVTEDKIEFEKFDNFRIVKSENRSESITDISPDIAVCDACLEDMKSQPHRFEYPFINCTNCGPRFSIIEDLPYDREKTTMSPFVMCETCRKEYEDVLDRRFHAQPVACNICGPVYQLNINGSIVSDLKEILSTVAHLINNGKIVAIKGVGGFQIACDAQNDETVNRLRELKNREGKPFAVMFSGLKSLRKFVYLNDAEERSITSWRRPVLILKEKRKLAPSISVGFDTIGAMLPYMPFHYQLFEYLNIPAIVLTSGNISDEPIVIDNDEAV